VTDDVLLERKGSVGLVTFNRPKALNALTLAMFPAIGRALDQWEGDPAVSAIVVRGAGGRAFCAGGDIRALWDTGPGLGPPDDPKRIFFRDEYRLILRVHRLKKPYIALLNGITMGGGAGMSMNGAVRVATDATLFAMPETAIGLFPDVGATHFLSRTPGKVGLYLALTGVRIKAADMLYAGLATHYVEGDRLDALLDALAAGEAPKTALARSAGDPGPAPLAPLRKQIDHCFGASSRLPSRASSNGWSATAPSGRAQRSSSCEKCRRPASR
jgi:enoyl-CoA hydratase